jgi:glycosyltransferase involved in cell wall biosynthesis
MRVVHVHRISGIGGSERHLLALLPALRAAGVEASLVGLDDPTGDPRPFYEALEAVPYARVPCPLDIDPRLPFRIARAAQQFRPQLVHTHLVHADVYGAGAAMLLRVPLVSTKHNDDPFRIGPFRLVERLLARRASAVIAITASLARFNAERVGIPRGSLEVIHYGLDEPPAAWRRDSVDAPAGPMILAVGRLAEQKGFDTAVRALPAVRAACPDAFLAIIGEGPLRPELTRLAADLGVAESVLMPGRSGDVTAWMRRADVFVHPARWEGFGLVVLEAMLTGLPVVASRVSALPELIEDGPGGILVEPGSAAQLSAAVIDLLRNPARRAEIGASARARAQACFSVKRMADATATLYRRIAAASSPAAQDSVV